MRILDASAGFSLPLTGVRGKGTVRIHEDIEHNIPIIEKQLA